MRTRSATPAIGERWRRVENPSGAPAATPRSRFTSDSGGCRPHATRRARTASSCIACHRVEERIAGPFETDTDAHPTTRHPSFTAGGSVSLCASCHDTTIGPVHALAADFLASGLAERGKSCIGCHMPRALRAIATDPDSGAENGPPRDGRSHALRGPGDPEFCAEAFKIALAPAPGGALELAVGNRAGHRVPGLDLRRFVVIVRQLDAKGGPVAENRVVFSTENPLYVRETRRFRIPRARGAVRAETVLVHELDGEAVAELSREEHTW